MTLYLRRGHGAILAIALATALSACSRDSADKFLASGKSYLDTGNYPAAIIQFKNAAQKDPNNPEVRYQLGMAFKESGDLAGAEVELRKAADAGLAPDRVYPALARVLLQRGQFEKLLTELQGKSIDGAAKADVLALAGEAQLGLRRKDEAQSAFSSALSADPANQTAKLGMARLAALDRDYSKARSLVDEVLTRSPSSGEALMLKGDLLSAERQDKAAAEAYEAATKAQPYNVRAYYAATSALLRSRQLDAAKTQLGALKRIAPTAPPTLYLDALLSYTEGNRPRARELVQEVLKVSGDYAPALLLAGTIAYDDARYAQAEEYLRKAIAGAPADKTARRLLISAYLRGGQVRKAKEALTPLLKLGANDPQILGLAGEVALSENDAVKAVEYFERGAALEPSSASMRTRLGQAYLAAGNVSKAIQELEAASRADPSKHLGDVTLITLFLQRRELDKAQAAADVMARKAPQNPLTYNLQGLIQVARKERSAARSKFEQALQLDPTYFPAAQNLAVLDLQDGRADAAKQRYEAILTKDGKHEQALLALVDLQLQRDAASDEAIKAMDRAISGSPASVRARLAKVQYLLRRGQAKEALAAAQEAQAALPEDAQVLDVLGRAQFAAGETHQASTSFGKAADLAPSSPEPLLAQAQAFAAMKDWGAARQALVRALERQPDSRAARRGLVDVALRSGRLDDASIQARAIQKRWPKDATGYLAEADVLTEQKNWGDREILLREAIKTTGSPALVTVLYAQLDQQGETRKAEQLADEWTTGHPSDVLVPAFAGERSMQRKDLPAAARWFKTALRARPNNPAVLNNLAWVLGKMKDPAALEYANKALALAPNSAAVLDTVGSIYVENGDLARGVELMKKAGKLAPGTAAIQLNLAKALIKAGDRAAARAQLQGLTLLPGDRPEKQEAEKLLSTL